MAIRLQLKNVRLSYANIWHPVQPKDRAGRPDGDPKYSVALLIDKRDKANLGRLSNAIKEAMEADAQKIGRVDPRRFDKGVRNGDDKFADPEMTKLTPGYEGHYYVNAKANEGRPPQIVDNRKRPITNEAAVYSGCYCNVFVELYGYDALGNQGIGYGLLGIQKVADGEPLGATFTADLFDEFEADYEDPNDLAGDFDSFGDTAGGSDFDDFTGQAPRQANPRANQARQPNPGDWTPGGSANFDEFNQAANYQQRPTASGRTAYNRNQAPADDFAADDDFGSTPDFRPNMPRGGVRPPARNSQDPFASGSIDIADDDLPF